MKHVDCNDTGLGPDGWAPESACTPGQGWELPDSTAGSGAKAAFPFSAYLCWTVDLGLRLSPGSWALQGEVARFGG